jgi:hypothetical protein
MDHVHKPTGDQVHKPNHVINVFCSDTYTSLKTCKNIN